MPDISYPTAPRQSEHLRLVPPVPGATRRPSLLARFFRWLFGDFSYEEIEQELWERRFRGYCMDCDRRVDVVSVHGFERCARCDGKAVDELGWLYLRKGAEDDE